MYLTNSSKQSTATKSRALLYSKNSFLEHKSHATTLINITKSKGSSEQQARKMLDIDLNNKPSSSKLSSPSLLPSSMTTKPTSLFDPKFEKAACGVGFIVNINGQASRKVNLQPIHLPQLSSYSYS